MQWFSWNWQGRPVEAVYETLGTGSPVLLLPAFSTVSSREEMRPLASRLAVSGFACTLVGWPGFRSSTRGRLDYRPALYHGFLADLVAATMPDGTGVVAAGHANDYALALGHERPVYGDPSCYWRRLGADRCRRLWAQAREPMRWCARWSGRPLTSRRARWSGQQSP
jgi:hypothetical protein